jgi:hypothetical protein
MTAKPVICRWPMPHGRQFRCSQCYDYINGPDTAVIVGEDLDSPIYHEDCAEGARIG